MYTHFLFLFLLLALFADDIKCYKTIADIMDSTQLQKDLNLLNIWSIDTNLLTVQCILDISHEFQGTVYYVLFY